MPAKPKAKTHDTSWGPKKATNAALDRFAEAFQREMGAEVVRAPEIVYQPISTGSLALDAAVKIGGWPKGRIVEIWGPEHAGKSTLALLAAAEAQKNDPDRAVGWIDMEQCLRQSELVRLADGRRVPAIDLVGQEFEVYTSTPEGHTRVRATAALMPSPTEVFRVTTKSGRTLEVNGKHPLFSAFRNGLRLERGGLEVRGWTEVQDLAPGQFLAVPERTEHVPDLTSGETLSEDEAIVLGMLVGDGSITAHPTLTTPAGPMAEEFARRAESLGATVSMYAQQDGKVAVWGTRGHSRVKDANPVTALLRRTGLWGLKSRERFIPDQVFASDLEALSGFIGGLYAADGHIHVGRPSLRQPNGLVRIEYDTTSRRLAGDLQEALLRFGVHSTIRCKRLAGAVGALMGKETSTLWTVQVTTAHDQLRFASAVRIPGKEAALEELRQRAEVISGSPRANPAWIRHGLNPGLRWDEVVSVQSLGQDRIVGLTVPGHHTYLSTFWEHNTFDSTWARTLGVDLSRLVLFTPKTAEDVADATKRFVGSGMFSLVILDSVGGMISRVEFEKEADEATVGLVAKTVTRMVKQAAPMCHDNGTILMVVNQVRAKIGGFGNPEDTSGGWALKHVTSIKVQVRRGEPIKARIMGEDVTVGHEVVCRVQKNKVAAGGGTARFILYNQDTAKFSAGVDQVTEVYDVAKKYGVLGKGGWVVLPDGEKVNGKEKAVAYLREHPETVEKIRENVLNKIKTGDLRDEDDESEEYMAAEMAAEMEKS